jgi:hypothetical protein
VSLRDWNNLFLGSNYNILFDYFEVDMGGILIPERKKSGMDLSVAVAVSS